MLVEVRHLNLTTHYTILTVCKTRIHQFRKKRLASRLEKHEGRKRATVTTKYASRLNVLACRKTPARASQLSGQTLSSDNTS
jgi:hypothetical protein